MLLREILGPAGAFWGKAPVKDSRGGMESLSQRGYDIVRFLLN